MALVYLVRHARPAGGWADAVDPGLDPRGVEQAREAATLIAALTAPLPVWCSPMRRCRETAAPLAQRWQREAIVLPEVSELPSPPGPLPERAAWLRGALLGSWPELSRSAPPGAPDFAAWRSALLAALAGLTEDAVVFTHYIGINAAVGAARGSDAVQVFRPDHGSITVMRCAAHEPLRPQLLQLGREIAGAADVAPLPGRVG